MHEGGFTKDIVDAILQEISSLSEAPWGVQVKMGEMLHLEPESVRLHFGVMTKGTALEDTHLELEETPVIVRCRDCGKSGGVDDHHLLLCQECGSPAVNVVEGKIVSVALLDQAPSIS